MAYEPNVNDTGPEDKSAVETAALAYVAAGRSVAPIYPNQKYPKGNGWKIYQNQLPTTDEIRNWFRRTPLLGLCIICGEVSGNLENLDFDELETYHIFVNLVTELGYAELLERVIIEHTPRPGVHLGYRCEVIEGNRKLARQKVGVLDNGKDDIKTLIETRGEGGLIVVAPTPPGIHPDCPERGYALIQGDWTTPPLITPEEREILWNCARALNRYTPESRSQSYREPSSDTDRVGNDYNAQVSVDDLLKLLEGEDWQNTYSQGDGHYLRRPGKTRGGWSATLNICGPKRFYVFSSSVEHFDNDRSYDPFGVYMRLKHEGDGKAAAKALAELGYGRNGQPSGATKNTPEREEHQSTPSGHRLVIPWSDYTNAVELIEAHGQNLRYCHPAKSWYVWDGKRWLADETAAVMRLATDAIKAMAIRIMSMNNPESKALLAHLKTSLSTSKLKAMVDQSSWLPNVPVLPKELDQHPWLLNCLNGTLDLRTGKLQPHRRDDLLTMITAAEYHPDARSKVWESFLQRILPDESDRRYVQKAAGYSLTGLGTEDVLFFPFGPTKTGKSTLLKGLRATWGDYATTADFETFLTREYVTGAPRADIAGLAGKRLVVSLEVDQGKKLAEALIKWLFGGDYVTARFLYKKEFEFLPTFKLWLASNHRPQVSSDDDAIWERIRQIPFEQTIPKDERDPGIKAELSDPDQSGAAILAWAVEGCRLWKQEGLGIPKHVEDMTEAYRKEMDPMPDFIEACLVNDEKSRVLNAAMWECYQTWSRKNRDRPKLGRKTFTQRLEQAGIDSATSGGYLFWLMVRLRYHTTGDQEDSEKPSDEL